MIKGITNALKKKHHYGRYAIVASLIKGDGRNLLDIGCGSPSDCMRDGSFLRFLGYGQGIDIEQRNIEFPFKLGSILDIPFPDKKFDVVTAVEVLEHIDDFNKALNEVHRILKNNGIFVMTTPNNTLFFRTFWSLWEKTFGRKWKGAHLTFYTKKDWIGILKKTGCFKIEKVIDYWNVNVIIKMRKI